MLLVSLVAFGCDSGSKSVVSEDSLAATRIDKPKSTPDPFAGSPSRFGEVDLHAGFNPDPHAVTGTALGERNARDIHKRCTGWISEKPDYLLNAQTAFYKLHVLARSSDDIVVVVRGADGKVTCNDNRPGGTDPMVHAPFPIGTAQVWVGVQQQGAKASYRLAFSEVKWKPSELSLP